jgi:hypothetical protein
MLLRANLSAHQAGQFIGEIFARLSFERAAFER